MHEMNSRDNQSQLMEWLHIKGERYWISCNYLKQIPNLIYGIGCNCHKGKSITPKPAAAPILRGYPISHKNQLHLM